MQIVAAGVVVVGLIALVRPVSERPVDLGSLVLGVPSHGFGLVALGAPASLAIWHLIIQI